VNRFSSINVLSLILLATLSAAGQSNNLDERLERAAGLIRDNRIQEAELQLNNILKTAPQEARALSLLGTIRGSQGKLDEAESLFERALTINSQMIPARMNLAYVYLLKGAQGKTISELKEVLRLDPSYAEAREKLARLLLSQGQVDECISFIENSKQSQSAALFVVLGDAYLRKGDAKKAEESYLLALDKQNDAADALLGMAQLAQLGGDSKTASLYLSRAKEPIANSPDLLYRFALIALKSEAIEEARFALEKAVKVRPTEAAYFLALGDTWLRKPDLFEAEQAFRRALALRPDSSQGQMYLGYTLLKQKKYPEAREWLEKSIQKDVGTPETFYYLGLIAQEQREEEQAVRFFEKSIQLSPSFGHPHIALGSTYLKQKDYQRARAELEIGVKLNPDDSKAHYNLALLYARLNDPQRASEEMQILEKLKNGNERVKENEVSVPPPPRPRQR